jgi:hypothetical protein
MISDETTEDVPELNNESPNPPVQNSDIDIAIALRSLNLDQDNDVNESDKNTISKSECTLDTSAKEENATTPNLVRDGPSRTLQLNPPPAHYEVPGFIKSDRYLLFLDMYRDVLFRRRRELYHVDPTTDERWLHLDLAVLLLNDGLQHWPDLIASPDCIEKFTKHDVHDYLVWLDKVEEVRYVAL